MVAAMVMRWRRALSAMELIRVPARAVLGILELLLDYLTTLRSLAAPMLMDVHWIMVAAMVTRWRRALSAMELIRVPAPVPSDIQELDN